MNRLQTFQEFLATQSMHIPVLGFLLNLLLAGLLAFLLSKVYVRYGNSLSNRRLFGRNFLMLTMTTMFIITIVKSSLALSLGLVGALSIVRFRAAIKEPEELGYLFLAIAIGLGLGADQTVITMIGFLIIVSMIVFRKKVTTISDSNQNLHLVIQSQKADDRFFEKLVKQLKSFCSVVHLKRFDESKDVLEVTFLIEIEDFNQLTEMKNALLTLNDTMRISFLDNKGVL
jgi:uncharacterized membrane protein YhiD involved in acid resistance